MSDTTETLSAILAEMTEFCSGWSEDVDVTVKVGLIYGWKCRIEAAAERERAGTIYAGRNGEMTLDECIVRCDNNSGDNPRGRDVAQIGGWLRELRERRNAPGNAAAMREALEEIYNEAQNICDYCDEQRIVSHRADKIERIVNTALAAPARNVDRFATAEEAMEEWGKYPQSRYKGCRLCPHGDASMVSPSHLTLAEWLFATAKGGDHA